MSLSPTLTISTQRTFSEQILDEAWNDSNLTRRLKKELFHLGDRSDRRLKKEQKIKKKRSSTLVTGRFRSLVKGSKPSPLRPADQNQPFLLRCALFTRSLPNTRAFPWNWWKCTWRTHQRLLLKDRRVLNGASQPNLTQMTSQWPNWIMYTQKNLC